MNDFCACLSVSVCRCVFSLSRARALFFGDKDLHDNYFIGELRRARRLASLRTLSRKANETKKTQKTNAPPGFLPTELGVLTNLEVLSMRRNALQGSLPSELNLLTRLTTL